MPDMPRRLFGLLIVLAIACVSHNTWTACTGSHQLLTQDAYLVSNPDWGGAGGNGSCRYAGCYSYESGPPTTMRPPPSRT